VNRIDTELLRSQRLRGHTVTEVVFDFFRRQGMTRVFGNPGSTEIPMFADLPEDFTYVLGLQEASVVFMADAYAQITGQAQFVSLHSAAGLGNAMGALYTAFRDRAPLVIVTGQQSRSILPHEPFLFNESPAEMPKPYVKWATEPARAADVPAAIAKAYYIAMQPPRGPVLVSVPLSDWDEIAPPLPERGVDAAFAPTSEALDKLAARLDAAREPAVVVGPLVDADGAWDATVRLAERLQAKVWGSPKSPRASFPETHPLFAGFLPAVQPGLADCLKGADFVLVLGAPVFNYHFAAYGDDPRHPGSPEHVPAGADLCLITDDPRQAAGAAVGSSLLSNMKLAAEGLAARVRQRAIRTEPARARPARVPLTLGITQDFFYQTLGELRSPDSILVEEAPSSHEALHAYYPIVRPNGFLATASGCLGYGLAGGVGAALTRPDKPVICVVGDGSSLYTIQALWSAAEYDADILVIVLNNGGYRVLEAMATREGAKDIDGVRIGHVDFVKLAEGQGVRAARCAKGAELADTLKTMLAEKGPRLLEVMIATKEDAMNMMAKAARAPKAPDRFFIGGRWVEPLSNRKLDVISPVTEERILSYPEASQADMDRAVAAAREAFDNGPWPRMAPSERARCLRTVAERLAERLDDIAYSWTLQVGAPIMLTKKLVGQNPTLFNYYADLAETYPFVDERKRDDGGKVKVVKEPVGVCAAITPWNAPLVLLSYKVAAGLAAGCTIVSKPSPETPLEAYILAEGIEKAGLPPGVFNLVPAGRESGDYLVRHAGIDKVAFTGSTAAGKHIAAVCAERLARVSLELGGKSAAILLDDADFKAALPPLMIYTMPITGQVCFSLTRILVPESRKQEFLDLYLGAVSGIKVGDPFDPGTHMGPLTMARQLDRVQGYIAAGRSEGARLLCGGGRPKGLNKGYYIEPTVFTDVKPEMRIFQEEIFGPVVSVIGYTDDDDAVAKANDSTYGLSGAVFTTDPDRGYAIARRMRTGSVTVNGMIVDPKHPFGGFKQSGIGREGGPEGLDNYIETKTIHIA
jgi:acyl-CoA reductase-like NAD-dependent aldehyde dehydrogenase/thiamine pyrophosphate-dependent acetolactate synthase large subunit-like protein